MYTCREDIDEHINEDFRKKIKKINKFQTKLTNFKTVLNEEVKSIKEINEIETKLGAINNDLEKIKECLKNT